MSIKLKFYNAYFATESRKLIRELSQIIHLQQSADCIIFVFFFQIDLFLVETITTDALCLV